MPLTRDMEREFKKVRDEVAKAVAAEGALVRADAESRIAQAEAKVKALEAGMAGMVTGEALEHLETRLMERIAAMTPNVEIPASVREEIEAVRQKVDGVKDDVVTTVNAKLDEHRANESTARQKQDKAIADHVADTDKRVTAMAQEIRR